MRRQESRSDATHHEGPEWADVRRRWGGHVLLVLVAAGFALFLSRDGADGARLRFTTIGVSAIIVLLIGAQVFLARRSQRTIALAGFVACGLGALCLLLSQIVAIGAVPKILAVVASVLFLGGTAAFIAELRRSFRPV